MGDTLIAGAPHQRRSLMEDRSSMMEAGGTARSVECTCPLEVDYHSWRLIHTDVIPLAVNETYHLMFVHERFMMDVLAARKCSKYVATAWAPDPEGSGHRRTITYHMPVAALARNAIVTETQVLSNLNLAGEVYAVTSEVSNEGVPMGDSFSIQIHVCLLRADPPEDEGASGTSMAAGDWCRYSCYVQMKYKNVWSIFRGQLERYSYSGIEAVHKEVVEALRGHVSRGASRVLTARSVRHKRRRKTASTDLTQRMRMEALRQGSNNKPVSSDWSLFVNTCFILMLVTSFAVNAWLYHRVRMLEFLTSEGRPGDDLLGESWSRGRSAAEDGHLSGLRRTFKSMDEGVWGHVAGVLHQEERVYLTELHDMADHLLHASHALGQADAEIHTVLRQLPVIQEERVNDAKRDLQRRMELGEERKQRLEEKQFIVL